MKKLGIILACVVILAGMMVVPGMAKKSGCVTIQDGVLTYPPGRYLAGDLLITGYDPYGYNYQAHMFKGYFSNVYLNAEGFPPYEGDSDAYLAENPGAGTLWHWQYRDIQLIMKWNDAWLSNKDCVGDGLLDRHYGFTSYIGSGAWETNHQSRGKGKDHWVYFCKIVAVPADAYVDGGYWYTADDVEIGPVIWGSFAIIQEVESGLGATYVSPAGPGFGKYKP